MSTIDTAQAAEVARAVALLRAGELVGMPTETVYGLAADASNPAAVARIFAAKGRPADHPVIVHLPDATDMSSQLSRWAREIPPAAQALAAAFWPGPLTLILKRQPDVSDLITGGQDTVGLRVPAHPLAQALLKAFGSGLAAPSANRFGRISPTTAAHVRDELGPAVAMVLDGGPCPVGIESTIVDLSGDVPRILRPGRISAAQVAAIVGPLAGGDSRQGTGTTPRVSGSLDAHYAPRTPMQLCAGQAFVDALAGTRIDERVGVLSMRTARNDARFVWRTMPGEAAPYATALYAALRTLDGAGCDRLIVEAPPQEPVWLAVNDRLHRAATGAGHSAG